MRTTKRKLEELEEKRKLEMKEGEIMKKGKIKRNGPGNLKSIKICKANYSIYKD